jgi:predicted transcriptional regulator
MKKCRDGELTLMDEEDNATLAAIDRGMKDADEGRLIPVEEVRVQMKKWPTKSPSLRKH